MFTDEQQALLALGRLLQKRHYRFITVTPETHRRVLAQGARSPNDRHEPRAAESPLTLRDVLGHNRFFTESEMAAEIVSLLRAADALENDGGLLRSRVRFSTMGEQLFVHSGFPTTQIDAVFFGPDTYRFARALRACRHAEGVLVDIGAGSGAGGISLARGMAVAPGIGDTEGAQRLVLADMSAKALSFAAVNAALNGVTAELVVSDVLASVSGPIDAVVANPPYLLDPLGRAYRDGGGCYGEALAVRILQQSLDRLSPRGTLALYTGAPVISGQDVFLRAIEPMLPGAARFTYEELDPDVFGEELAYDAYAGVERIAAVFLWLEMPG